ncbi:sulfatase [Engelhardtia mirabilis]|uniref:Arylsulfatase n=1 Tax=Engelhardtia mirabilis TaxID=2528011 RepID=A0A518BFV2_9BACT|nr:Arylsulfatase precursor [Planctomycetes bacterium Pla133]QDV00119.1 Arylsulfatase precursor [Planctomycetes bacterium Pla86]
MAIDAVAARTNIVLMIVDDLGWQDTALGLHELRPPFQGSYRTPHLLRLAEEGLVFTDAHASAPVCTPSRVSLITGQSPARHGVTYWVRDADRDTSAGHPHLRPPAWNVNGLQPGAVTLPALLAEVGYRTIHVGKAHWGAVGTPGADPMALGFEVNVAGHGLGAPGSYLGVDGFGNLREDGPSPWSVPGLEPWHGEQVWLTDVLAQRADGELRAAHAAGEPFFLYLAPYAVHTPITANPELVEHYADLPPVEAAYASMIEGVDNMLGRVLATLDELDLAGETLFVFTSDNGGLSAHGRAGEPHVHNAPLRSGKGSAYEGGTRVPLVVRWPGHVEPGRRTTQTAVLHDLFPTLLTAARAEIPAEHLAQMDGVDLTATCIDADRDPQPRTILWHQPHFWGVNGPGIEPYSALRVGDEKLIWFHDGGRLELYDVAADPGESNELCATRPERVAALVAVLVERLRAVDAGLSIDKATGEAVPFPAVDDER